ncbi:hypothetical protein RU639_011575 [Aspergillus parasiticus]
MPVTMRKARIARAAPMSGSIAATPAAPKRQRQRLFSAVTLAGRSGKQSIKMVEMMLKIDVAVKAMRNCMGGSEIRPEVSMQIVELEAWTVEGQGDDQDNAEEGNQAKPGLDIEEILAMGTGNNGLVGGDAVLGLEFGFSAAEALFKQPAFAERTSHTAQAVRKKHTPIRHWARSGKSSRSMEVVEEVHHAPGRVGNRAPGKERGNFLFNNVGKRTEGFL